MVSTVTLYSDDFHPDTWDVITSIVGVPNYSDGVSLTVCNAVPTDEDGILLKEEVKNTNSYFMCKEESVSTRNSDDCVYDTFTLQAKLSQQLKHTIEQVPKYSELSDVQREALDMIMHKVANIVTNQSDKECWVDIVKYANLADRNVHYSVPEVPPTLDRLLTALNADTDEAAIAYLGVIARYAPELYSKYKNGNRTPFERVYDMFEGILTED